MRRRLTSGRSHPLPGPLTVGPEPLSGADAQLLIARLNAELTERYPNPEDNHFHLDETELGPGRGVFLVARIDGSAIGCAALRRLDSGTGEIKRMYVAPDFRGRGVARRILGELERCARILGLRRLVLETGDRQHEAIRLYGAAGFLPIPCFGEYVHSAASRCMEKHLAR